MAILDSLHTRWVNLLEHLGPADWQRAVFHPGSGEQVTLAKFLALYAWHGKHHLGHLNLVKEKMGIKNKSKFRSISIHAGRWSEN